MKRLKNFSNIRAGSLLESVVALTIISICLLIAVLIYSAVFKSKVSVGHYHRENEMNSLFFNMQINHDSLVEMYNSENLLIEEEIEIGLKEIRVSYKDTLEGEIERKYYLQN